MRHSMSKDTAFNGETTRRHTFLCSDSQCLPPGDPRILCAKPGYPITGKSFIGTTVTFFSFHNLPFLFAKKFVLLYLIYYNYFITIVIYYLYSAKYIRRWSNALINSRLCLARAPPTSAGKQYPQGLRGEEGRGMYFLRVEVSVGGGIPLVVFPSLGFYLLLLPRWITVG